MRVHFRLKLVSVSWRPNLFLLQLVSGLLLFTLLVFRAALVNDLAQYPGCLVLFNMLLVVNIVTAMIFAYWRLTKNLYMVVSENWPESLLCKAPLVILQTRVLTMRGIPEMAEGLGKLIEKLQQHSARGTARGILDVMHENTSRYGGSHGGPQSTTSWVDLFKILVGGGVIAGGTGATTTHGSELKQATDAKMRTAWSRLQGATLISTVQVGCNWRKQPLQSKEHDSFTSVKRNYALSINNSLVLTVSSPKARQW